MCSSSKLMPLYSLLLLTTFGSPALGQIQVNTQTSVPEGAVQVTSTTSDTVSFAASDPNPIPHADGQCNENVPCDQSSISVGDVVLQCRPGCRRFCVDIPPGHEAVRGTAWIRNCDENTWHDPCPESGGSCPVGWVRVERTEWYPDTSRACIAVKNWSHNLNRCFAGAITFRRKQ